MTDFLDALEQQLIGAAALHGRAALPSTPAPSAGRDRSRSGNHRRALMILIPALLIFALGALALGGVIEIGAPAKPELSASEAGYGPLAPGTSRLAKISTPDPRGGPAWGMRVFSTKRGVGCIQVGRLLDGRLGALGQDGAFNDDGRFHEVPAGDAVPFSACSALDANGRIFNNVTVGEQAASGWSGLFTCVPATATAAEKAPEVEPSGRRHPVSVCAQTDERNLYYGLLGPEAKSITYTSGGEPRTLPTVGPEGAYLIVTQAPPRQLLDAGPGAGTSDVVPVDGPITAIQYRDGSTCHITARSWIGGTSACTPSLRVPIGYRALKTPTAAQAATPIRARVIRNEHGREEILVSFTSRVAITEYRSAYSLKLDESELHGRASAQYRAAGDAEVGQSVTMRIQRGLGLDSVPAGVYHGAVTLIAATGPALYEGPGTVYIPVGRFSVRVP